MAVATAVAPALAACTGGEPATPISTSTSPPTASSPSPSPGTTVEVDAAQALDLGGLTLPPDARVDSSVQRPNELGLRSYLVQIEATADAATTLCSQVSQPLPAGDTGLTAAELKAFGLTAEPAGALHICGASLPGHAVERRVLVATEADGARVWLSVYEVPGR